MSEPRNDEKPNDEKSDDEKPNDEQPDPEPPQDDEDVEIAGPSGVKHSGFDLRRPAELPTEYDFNPRGGRAPAAAWETFGNLTLRQAYRLFRTDPETYEEQFAHMGIAAFDYYFPVIHRYLHEVDPRDQDDHREARALGYTIAVQLNEPIEPRLHAEISDLVKHVLANLKDYAQNKAKQRQVAGGWKRAERKLRKSARG